MVQRIVVCMTTIPSRVSYLIPPLLSMKNQTHHIDKIFLFIPKISKKEGRAYPEIKFNMEHNIITDEIAHFELKMDNLEIFETEDDYGPITKMYPITKISKKEMGFDEKDEVLVICIDDDRNYSFYTVESLVKAYNSGPGCCAVSICGWIYGNGLEKWIKVCNPPESTMVDWLEASYGVLYNYDQLTKISDKFIDFAMLPEARYCDDMWISSLLKQHSLFPYIYSVPLLNFEINNKMVNDIQVSTGAKFINALQYNFKDVEDLKKNVSAMNYINTGYRYVKLANKLFEINPKFINSKPVPLKTGGFNYTKRIILLLSIILGVILLVVLLFIRGLKYYNLHKNEFYKMKLHNKKWEFPNQNLTMKK